MVLLIPKTDRNRCRILYHWNITPSVSAPQHLTAHLTVEPGEQDGRQELPEISHLHNPNSSMCVCVQRECAPRPSPQRARA